MIVSKPGFDSCLQFFK